MVESLFPLPLARRMVIERERLLEVRKVWMIEDVFWSADHDKVEIGPFNDVDGVVAPRLR